MSTLQRYLFLIPFSVLAVASVVASGGGGGGDDPAPADTAGAGGLTGGGDTGGGVSTGTVSGTCPPLNVGDTWTNLVTQTFMGDARTWTETVTVISNDGSEIVIEQTGDGYFGDGYTVATLHAISGTSVFEVGAADGEYTLEPPIPVCPTPGVGTSFEQIEADGDVRTSGIVTAATEEAVDVAAGSFSTIKTVYDIENYMATPTLLGTDTQWFADGVGPVKRLTTAPDFSYSVELQCYDFGASGRSGGDCGGATGGDTAGGTGGDTGGGTGTGTGAASTATYSGADLDGLGDGVITPLTYPNRDLPESPQSDGVSWFEAGEFPDPGLSTSLIWQNGQLVTVTFVAMVRTEVGGDLMNYTYSASCSASPDVCGAVVFDFVNQSVTFDNVVLPVANSISVNLATSPVTLNGTLPMYAP